MSSIWWDGSVVSGDLEDNETATKNAEGVTSGRKENHLIGILLHRLAWKCWNAAFSTYLDKRRSSQILLTQRQPCALLKSKCPRRSQN
eukprot:2812320-Amphidinium_carterae.1